MSSRKTRQNLFKQQRSDGIRLGFGFVLGRICNQRIGLWPGRKRERQIGLRNRHILCLPQERLRWNRIVPVLPLQWVLLQGPHHPGDRVYGLELERDQELRIVLLWGLFNRTSALMFYHPPSFLGRVPWWNPAPKNFLQTHRWSHWCHSHISRWRHLTLSLIPTLSFFGWVPLGETALKKLPTDTPTVMMSSYLAYPTDVTYISLFYLFYPIL